MFFCFCFLFPNTVLDYDRAAGVLSYGHITVKAPHPIRTAKLSIVELDQYFGRGLQGNLQCCRAFVFIFLVFTRCTCLGSNHGGLRVNGSVSQINFQKFC